MAEIHEEYDRFKIDWCTFPQVTLSLSGKWKMKFRISQIL